MAHMKEQCDEELRLQKLEDQARVSTAFQQLHMLPVELEGLSTDSAAVGARGCEFEERLACMGESKREQKRRKDDVQELINQMRRAQEDSNERFHRILKFINATCHLSQDCEFKEITTLSPSCCELSPSRGTPENPPKGLGIDSARMTLSRRIKRKAKISDDKLAKEAIGARHAPCEVVEQEAIGARHAPCEVVELAATDPSTETTCKDDTRPPEREVSPPASKINEMPLPCEASRQGRRKQMRLWPTAEKLSTLRILNNTMFLWEDKPALAAAAISEDLVLSTLAAARESQRRLFDALDTVRGVPRRTVCCSAVRELVRAYPPERLAPTSFINDHFRVNTATPELDVTLTSRGVLQMSAASLRSVQDSEAAEFWHALVHHVVALADHKMASLEESAKEFAQVLLEADVVGDAHLSLQSFLTRCFRTEPVSECPTHPPLDEDQDSSEELLPVSDTAPSQTEEAAMDRQVRDTTVTRGSKAAVATKHSRKSSPSLFTSLKFSLFHNQD